MVSEAQKSVLIWLAFIMLIIGIVETILGMYAGGNWAVGIVLLAISMVIFKTVKHKDNVTKTN